MKNVERKRRRGRPATGLTPIIALRLAVDEIQLVDELASELGVDRSKAVRVLLREGLGAYNKKQRRAKSSYRRAAAVNAEVVAEILEEAAEPEPSAASATLKRRPGFRRPPTPAEIKAAADRAERRRSDK